MSDYKMKSFVEIADELLREKKDPRTFMELFEEIAELKAYDDDEKSRKISTLYTDFITSGKFVYVGEDKWDLKEHQPVDLWDKDGAFYDEFPDYEEELEAEYDEEDEEEEDYDEEASIDEEDEEEELDYDEFEEEETIGYDEFEEDEEDYLEDEADLLFDDDEEEDDFDTEKYNEYMDEYEDMYDD